MINNNKIVSFKEFYPFYLSEHLHPICRLLHFTGTAGVITLIVLSVVNSNKLWYFAPSFGYSFAWAGHFFFEKNKPATFKYPVYSLFGDFLMFFHLLIRKEKFNSS